MRRFVKTEHPVEHLAWLDGGKYLVGLERFGGLNLWDAASGARRHRAEALGHQPHFLAPHPDGQRFATAATHFSAIHPPAQLWSVSRGRLIGKSLPEACGIHGGLAFTPDGSALIGGGEVTVTARRQLAAKVRCWDIGAARVGMEFDGHRGSIGSVVVWPDGQRVASAGMDGSVRVWDVRTGKAIASRKLGIAVRRLALSPDGRHLAAAVAKNPHVALMELTGKKLSATSEVRAHERPIATVAFAPDGRLVSVGQDGQLCLRRPDGSLQETIAVDTSPLECLAIAPDGRTVAVGCLHEVRFCELPPLDRREPETTMDARRRGRG
ncbi:MAG TPA: hypothetical protein VEL76_34920 [Gemmataceae bacterium]|nr:hypothetical protein [Gemmataceae bacterium]